MGGGNNNNLNEETGFLSNVMRGTCRNPSGNYYSDGCPPHGYPQNPPPSYPPYAYLYPPPVGYPSSCGYPPAGYPNQYGHCNDDAASAYGLHQLPSHGPQGCGMFHGCRGHHGCRMFHGCRGHLRCHHG